MPCPVWEALGPCFLGFVSLVFGQSVFIRALLVFLGSAPGTECLVSRHWSDRNSVVEDCSASCADPVPAQPARGPGLVSWAPAPGAVFLQVGTPFSRGASAQLWQACGAVGCAEWWSWRCAVRGGAGVPTGSGRRSGQSGSRCPGLLIGGRTSWRSSSSRG